MSYTLGVDIGSSVTSAAVWRDGRLSTVPLGTAAEGVPSAIFVLPDGGLLIGDAALQRGAADPDRLARGFFRQLADPVPQLLGTDTVPRAELTGQLLRYVLSKVGAREGGPPAHVTLTVPAAWGDHHRRLMTEVAAQAGLADVGLLAEPIAIAVHYAAQARLDVGSTVAVYDLGGATLDTALVRRTADGYELLGPPGGDDTVGGDVFDDVVMQHVRRSLGNALAMVDLTDAAVLAELQQIRDNAVAAKEALSSEVDTAIAVGIGGVPRQLRYTRGEFEGAIRIPVMRTVDALERTVAAAGLTVGQVQAVLLAGGSAQIPLVSQLLGSDLGIPVVTDAHPRYAGCLGAAMSSASRVEEAARLAAPSPVAVEPPPVVTDTAALLAAPEVAFAASPAETGVLVPVDTPVRAAPGVRPTLRYLSDRAELTAEYRGSARRGGLAILVAVIAVAVVVAAVLFVVNRGGSEPPADDTRSGVLTTADTAAASTSAGAVVAGPTVTPAALTLPAVAGEFATGVADTGRSVVLVGGSRDPVVPRVWLSSGASWVPAATPSLLGGGRVLAVNAVSAGRGRPIVVVGWSATPDEAATPADRRGEIWVSSDGAGWTPATVPEVGELTAVVRGPAGYLAIGQSYATDRSDGDAVALTSTDGAAWTPVSATGLDGPGPFQAAGLVADPAGFVALATRLDGAALRSGLWRSPDGVAWTFDRWLPVAGGGAAEGRGIGVDAAGGLVVVGAQSGASSGPMVWRTENGELVPHPVDLPGAVLSGVLAGPAGLIVVGEAAGGGAAAWTAP